jgi:hypothetical protein
MVICRDLLIACSFMDKPVLQEEKKWMIIMWQRYKVFQESAVLK